MDINTQPTADRYWTEHAACRGLDPNMFFPERGDQHGVANAKAVCAGCDVRAECLEYAIDTEQTLGIWGGKTRNDLQAERRTHTVRVVIVHGTDRGYHAHRRAHQQPCTACLRAHADTKIDYELQHGITNASRARSA